MSCKLVAALWTLVVAGVANSEIPICKGRAPRCSILKHARCNWDENCQPVYECVSFMKVFAGDVLNRNCSNKKSPVTGVAGSSTTGSDGGSTIAGSSRTGSVYPTPDGRSRSAGNVDALKPIPVGHPEPAGRNQRPTDDVEPLMLFPMDLSKLISTFATILHPSRSKSDDPKASETSGIISRAVQYAKSMFGY